MSFLVAILTLSTVLLPTTSVNIECTNGVDAPTEQCVLSLVPNEVRDMKTLQTLIKYCQSHGKYQKELQFITRALELQPNNQQLLGMQVVMKWCVGRYMQGWEDSIRLLNTNGMLPQNSVAVARKVCGTEGMEEFVNKADDKNSMASAQDIVVALYLAKNPEASRLKLESLINNTTTLTPLHLLYLHTFIVQKMWGKSRVYLKELVGLYPDNFYLHYQEAIVHLSNSSTWQALSSLNKSIMLNPNFPRSHYLQFKCKHSIKDYHGALVAALEWERTVGDSEWETQTGDACYMIGSLYFELKNFTLAEQYLRRSATLPTKKENSRQRSSYELLFETYRNLKNIYHQTAVLAVLASRWSSEQVQTLLQSTMHSSSHLIDSAALLKTLHSWNCTAHILARIGQMYNQQGHVESALLMNQAAIEADSQFASPYIGKGISFCKLGNIQQALAWFSKGILLEKQGDIYGLTQRGKCLLKAQRFAEAKSDFQEAMRRSPRSELHSLIEDCKLRSHTIEPTQPEL